MEWGDVDLALEAFVLGNHHTLFAKTCTVPPSLTDGQAYTFKMAFSSNTSLDGSGGGGGGSGVINV
jgi:hypothetical protein